MTFEFKESSMAVVENSYELNPIENRTDASFGIGWETSYTGKTEILMKDILYKAKHLGLVDLLELLDFPNINYAFLTS